MLSHVCLVKLMWLDRRSMPLLDHPARYALAAKDQAEFFICPFDPDMFDITAGEATAPDETIARQPGPAHLNEKLAYAAS